MELFYEHPIIYSFIIIISAFGGIAIIKLIFTAFRVPRRNLSEEQISNLCKYGLLHYLKYRDVEQIKKNHIIYRTTWPQLYIGEKYMTWYFPCTKPADLEYVRITGKKMKKMQPRADACIHITDISEDVALNLLCNPRTNHIIHMGNLKCPNIKIFEKSMISGSVNKITN